MSGFKVNGLLLPSDLLRLIECGEWRRPANVTALKELTAVQRPEEFTFLSIEGMERETAGGRKLAAATAMAAIYGLASSKWSGQSVVDRQVLDVDLAVMIAVNWDEEAIFLDYRDGLECPSVVLGYWPDNCSGSKYRRIANDVSDSANKIGLISPADTRERIPS